MEDAVRHTFRIKFIKLVILLNIFIFTLTGAALVLFLIPSEISFKIPLVAILSIAAVISGVISRNDYIRTKQWLEVHGKSE